jgi:HSP20 family protein
MAEAKVIQKSEEKTELARRWPGLNLLDWRSPFNPMAPFADAFGANPFGLMREFAKEVNKFFPGFPAREFSPEGWMPLVEIKKVDGGLKVTADLPGVKKDDLKIEISDQALTVQGERKSEKKEEKEGVYRSEQSYGRFYRSIFLPEGAKTGEAKAELNNGVLEITIPMAETKPNTRQIPISEAAKEKAAGA